MSRHFAAQKRRWRKLVGLAPGTRLCRKRSSRLSPIVGGLRGRVALTGNGTRVASIIGAVANNNIGIAGVMWNSSLYLYSAGTATGGLDSTLLTQYASQAISDQVRVVNWSIGADCVKCTAKDLTQ